MIAQPILEELARQIDKFGLEEWESADLISHPLTLLLRCLAKSGQSGEDRQKIYARICRLDPVQALSLPK